MSSFLVITIYGIFVLRANDLCDTNGIPVLSAGVKTPNS